MQLYLCVYLCTIDGLFLLQEMERTVHVFETFLWTLQVGWVYPLKLLMGEQSSEPFSFHLHQVCAEPWS